MQLWLQRGEGLTALFGSSDVFPERPLHQGIVPRALDSRGDVFADGKVGTRLYDLGRYLHYEKKKRMCGVIPPPPSSCL